MLHTTLHHRKSDGHHHSFPNATKWYRFPCTVFTQAWQTHTPVGSIPTHVPTYLLINCRAALHYEVVHWNVYTRGPLYGNFHHVIQGEDMWRGSGYGLLMLLATARYLLWHRWSGGQRQVTHVMGVYNWAIPNMDVGWNAQNWWVYNGRKWWRKRRGKKTGRQGGRKLVRTVSRDVCIVIWC